jgi:predicted DNA-binding transcriptional regulator AlpA
MNNSAKEAINVFADLPDTSYVRLPVVLSLFGISRSTLYRAVARGDITPPIKITSRTSAWHVGNLRACIANKLINQN